MGRGNCVSLDTFTANKDINNISIELEIWRMWSFFFHLSSHRLGMGHVVTTLAPTFLMESSSFFQVARKYMQALISSNFDQIPPLTP